MLLRSVIVILSLVGLADALYFTFAYYGRIKKARWVPELFCAREGSSCVTVVQTKYARVFGVPNSLLGIIYYCLLMIGVTDGWSFGIDLHFQATYIVLSLGHALMILASAVTVALGFYLIYALRTKLHTHCPLCYLGHAINATLFIILILPFISAILPVK
jgi:uncharacterized membrane protein